MTESAEAWGWPDELDALVAAPDNHRLVFENDEVRVLDTWIRPGETVPMHTHRWPAVIYVFASDHIVRRDIDGEVLLDTRMGGEPPEPGAGAWIGPLPPHTVENVGESELRFLNLELKR
jgi:quercetin dioxygenase-like cupin family protein